MTTYFQLADSDDDVVNVLSFDDTATLSGNAVATTGNPLFLPPAGHTFFNQAGATIGWTVGLGGILNPPLGVTSPSRTLQQLKDYASKFQSDLAAGGHTVTVAGTPHLFPTDPATASRMAQVALRLTQAGPPATVNWQIPTGMLSISAANFTTLSIAIQDWVQSTVDALAAVLAAIQATTITTYAQIVGATWPTP